MLCHNKAGVNGSRLCIDDFEGSSRRILLTMIFSSRGVNQPFAPRIPPAVEVGDEGMSTKARRPTTNVMSPFQVVSRDIKNKNKIRTPDLASPRSKIAISILLALQHHEDAGFQMREKHQGHQRKYQQSRRSQGAVRAHGACRSTTGRG